MHFIHLNLNYNKEYLRFCFDLVEYEDFKVKNPSKVQDPFFTHAPGWQIHRDVVVPVVEELRSLLADTFNAKVRSQFFIQKAGTEVPYHTDGRPLASVNLLVSDNNSPITFEDIGDVHYECALLNIKKRHMVRASSEDRYLLNFSILDKTYKECYERLPHTFKS